MFLEQLNVMNEPVHLLCLNRNEFDFESPSIAFGVRKNPSDPHIKYVHKIIFKLSEMFNRNVLALQLTITCELAEGVNDFDPREEAQKPVMDDKMTVGAFILYPQAGGHKLQERFWPTSAASITEGPAFSSADLQKHN